MAHLFENRQQTVAALLLFVSLATAGQSSLPKPLSVYIRDIDTNLKGDFGDAASGITTNLELAFTMRTAFFKTLDRRHISEATWKVFGARNRLGEVNGISTPAEPRSAA